MRKLITTCVLSVCLCGCSTDPNLARFKKGDVVALKSSPDRKMTIYSCGVTSLYCNWMDEHGRIQRSEFYPQELIHEIER